MSSQPRKSLMPLCAVLVMLAVSASAGAQSDSTAEDTDLTSIERLRELRAVEAERLAAIATETEVNGPMSANLYELYLSLASHYSERDDNALATAALEQALHINRVTHGLFSMQQAEVTQALIASNLDAGQVDRAIELDAQLMRIAWQNLDDVRTVDILSAAADRSIGIYQLYLDGELPPQITINMNSGPGGTRITNPNRFIGLSNLASARRNWSAAINVLLAAGSTDDQRLVEYELKLIESYYTQWNEAELRGDRVPNVFGLGRMSYQRLLSFAAANNDVEVAAMAMIGLADWHLLFHRNASAVRMYAEAYDALVRLGVDESNLADLFTPDVPIVLPAFTPNPLARTSIDRRKAPASDEYLSVTIAMSRYGRSRLRDLSITPMPTQESIEDEIRRIVARSRFRPIVIDGEAQRIDELEFRYYVDSDKS